jgi:hypothetical protein
LRVVISELKSWPPHQARTLHPDFQEAARTAGDFLEKLLDFYFTLQGRRPKRRRRRSTPVGPRQERLELDSDSLRSSA